MLKKTIESPWFKWVIRLFVSVGLFAFILKKVEFNLVLQSLSQVRLLPVLTALAMTFCAWVPASRRFLKILAAFDYHLRLGEVYKVNLIASCFNFAVPGQVAGEFVRYRFVSEGLTENKGIAAAVVLTDRILGLICLVILAFALWLSILLAAEHTLFLGLGLFLLFTFLFVYPAWLISRKFSPDAESHGPGWKGAVGSFFRPIFLRNPKLIFELVGCSLAFHLITACVTWQSGVAAGVSLPFVQWVFLYSLASLAQTLPVAVGGFGVREGVFVAYLGHLNIPLESALATSLLTFLLYAFLAFTGGVLYATRR